MAVTRLKRKVRKNKAKATQRKATMKRLLATPVIKTVSTEQLKKELVHAKESERARPDEL